MPNENNEDYFELFEDSDFPADEEEDNTETETVDDEDVDTQDTEDSDTTDDTEDEEDDNDEENEEEKDTENQDEEVDKDKQSKPAMFKLRFNHQDIEVPEEEVRILAQKGKNYDHVYEQLNTLKNDPRIAFIDSLVSEYGMKDAEEFMRSYHANQDQDMLDDLIEQGTPEKVARELVEARKAKREDSTKQSKDQTSEKDSQELSEFLDYYQEIHGKPIDPDKDLAEIPEEVWAANSRGVPLAQAYAKYLNKKLLSETKAKGQIEKQKAENKQKAVVKSVTKNGNKTVAKKDKAFDGLFDD